MSRAGHARQDASVVANLIPVADRRWAGDRAHRGDIEGAWGTLRAVDTGPRLSMRHRLTTLLAILGPGVIVMVADNDASGISLYAQAGQEHGLRVLWLLLLLAPVLFVNQEMVARLGAVTGAGHARLIFERFGRRWGRFAVGDLLVLNVLTIVTEFIGIALAGEYFGISRYVSVPLAAVTLIAVTVRGSFRGWERAMYVAIAGSLLVVPLAALAIAQHGHRSVSAEPAPAGLGTHGVLLTIALIGTTVAPWQLFLQQSNVVDKRVTSRWVRYERIDTAVGTVLFGVGAAAIAVACALVLEPAGTFVDAGHAARSLATAAGPWIGGLFAVALLNGSLLGAAAVTLSTSYAIGDATGFRQSLHRPWRQAWAFHGSFALLVLLAAVAVLLPATPLGLITVMVNVLAGVLLPSATVFLLLLCNDRAVLGPWVNPHWLNAVAGLVVAAMVALSALLVATTLFPTLPVPAAGLGVTIASGVVCGTVIWSLSRRSSATSSPRPREWERMAWSMPPLESLPAPSRSGARLVGLVALRAYLLVTAVLVVVKTVQLAFG